MERHDDRGRVSRRGFLKGGVAAGAAVLLPAVVHRGRASAAPVESRAPRIRTRALRPGDLATDPKLAG